MSNTTKKRALNNRSAKFRQRRKVKYTAGITGLGGVNGGNSQKNKGIEGIEGGVQQNKPSPIDEDKMHFEWHTDFNDKDTGEHFASGYAAEIIGPGGFVGYKALDVHRREKQEAQNKKTQKAAEEAAQKQEKKEPSKEDNLRRNYETIIPIGEGMINAYSRLTEHITKNGSTKGFEAQDAYERQAVADVQNFKSPQDAVAWLKEEREKTQGTLDSVKKQLAALDEKPEEKPAPAAAPQKKPEDAVEKKEPPKPVEKPTPKEKTIKERKPIAPWKARTDAPTPEQAARMKHVKNILGKEWAKVYRRVADLKEAGKTKEARRVLLTAGNRYFNYAKEAYERWGDGEALSAFGQPRALKESEQTGENIAESVRERINALLNQVWKEKSPETVRKWANSRERKYNGLLAQEAAAKETPVEEKTPEAPAPDFDELDKQYDGLLAAGALTENEADELAEIRDRAKRTQDPEDVKSFADKIADIDAKNNPPVFGEEEQPKAPETPAPVEDKQVEEQTKETPPEDVKGEESEEVKKARAVLDAEIRVYDHLRDWGSLRGFIPQNDFEREICKQIAGLKKKKALERIAGDARYRKQIIENGGIPKEEAAETKSSEQAPQDAPVLEPGVSMNEIAERAAAVPDADKFAATSPLGVKSYKEGYLDETFNDNVPEELRNDPEIQDAFRKAAAADVAALERNAGIEQDDKQHGAFNAEGDFTLPEEKKAVADFKRLVNKKAKTVSDSEITGGLDSIRRRREEARRELEELGGTPSPEGADAAEELRKFLGDYGINVDAPKAEAEEESKEEEPPVEESVHEAPILDSILSGHSAEESLQAENPDVAKDRKLSRSIRGLTDKFSNKEISFRDVLESSPFLKKEWESSLDGKFDRTFKKTALDNPSLQKSFIKAANLWARYFDERSLGKLPDAPDDEFFNLTRANYREWLNERRRAREEQKAAAQETAPEVPAPNEETPVAAEEPSPEVAETTPQEATTPVESSDAPVVGDDSAVVGEPNSVVGAVVGEESEQNPELGETTEAVESSEQEAPIVDETPEAPAQSVEQSEPDRLIAKSGLDFSRTPSEETKKNNPLGAEIGAKLRDFMYKRNGEDKIVKSLNDEDGYFHNAFSLIKEIEESASPYKQKHGYNQHANHIRAFGVDDAEKWPSFTFTKEDFDPESESWKTAVKDAESGISRDKGVPAATDDELSRVAENDDIRKLWAKVENEDDKLDQLYSEFDAASRGEGGLELGDRSSIDWKIKRRRSTLNKARRDLKDAVRDAIRQVYQERPASDVEPQTDAPIVDETAQNAPVVNETPKQKKRAPRPTAAPPRKSDAYYLHKEDDPYYRNGGDKGYRWQPEKTYESTWEDFNKEGPDRLGWTNDEATGERDFENDGDLRAARKEVMRRLLNDLGIDYDSAILQATPIQRGINEYVKDVYNRFGAAGLKGNLEDNEEFAKDYEKIRDFVAEYSDVLAEHLHSINTDAFSVSPLNFRRQTAEQQRDTLERASKSLDKILKTSKQKGSKKAPFNTEIETAFAKELSAAVKAIKHGEEKPESEIASLYSKARKMFMGIAAKQAMTSEFFDDSLEDVNAPVWEKNLSSGKKDAPVLDFFEDQKPETSDDIADVANESVSEEEPQATEDAPVVASEEEGEDNITPVDRYREGEISFEELINSSEEAKQTWNYLTSYKKVKAFAKAAAKDPEIQKAFARRLEGYGGADNLINRAYRQWLDERRVAQRAKRESQVDENGRTPGQNRVIDKFNDIVSFYEKNGRLPNPNSEDGAETELGYAFEHMKESKEKRELLQPFDKHSLFETAGTSEKPVSDEQSGEPNDYLDRLGVVINELKENGKWNVGVSINNFKEMPDSKEKVRIFQNELDVAEALNNELISQGDEKAKLRAERIEEDRKKFKYPINGDIESRYDEYATFVSDTYKDVLYRPSEEERAAAKREEQRRARQTKARADYVEEAQQELRKRQDSQEKREEKFPGFSDFEELSRDEKKDLIKRVIGRAKDKIANIPSEKRIVLEKQIDAVERDLSELNVSGLAKGKVPFFIYSDAMSALGQAEKAQPVAAQTTPTDAPVLTEQNNYWRGNNEPLSDKEYREYYYPSVGKANDEVREVARQIGDRLGIQESDPIFEVPAVQRALLSYVDDSQRGIGDFEKLSEFIDDLTSRVSKELVNSPDEIKNAFKTLGTDIVKGKTGEAKFKKAYKALKNLGVNTDVVDREIDSHGLLSSKKDINNYLTTLVKGTDKNKLASLYSDLKSAYYKHVANQVFDNYSSPDTGDQESLFADAPVLEEQAETVEEEPETGTPEESEPPVIEETDKKQQGPVRFEDVYNGNDIHNAEFHKAVASPNGVSFGDGRFGGVMRADVKNGRLYIAPGRAFNPENNMVYDIKEGIEKCGGKWNRDTKEWEFPLSSATLGKIRKLDGALGKYVGRLSYGEFVKNQKTDLSEEDVNRLYDTPLVFSAYNQAIMSPYSIFKTAMVAKPTEFRKGFETDRSTIDAIQKLIADSKEAVGDKKGNAAREAVGDAVKRFKAFVNARYEQWRGDQTIFAQGTPLDEALYEKYVKPFDESKEEEQDAPVVSEEVAETEETPTGEETETVEETAEADAPVVSEEPKTEEVAQEDEGDAPVMEDNTQPSSVYDGYERELASDFEERHIPKDVQEQIKANPEFQKVFQKAYIDKPGEAYWKEYNDTIKKLRDQYDTNPKRNPAQMKARAQRELESSKESMKNDYYIGDRHTPANLQTPPDVISDLLSIHNKSRGYNPAFEERIKTLSDDERKRLAEEVVSYNNSIARQWLNTDSEEHILQDDFATKTADSWKTALPENNGRMALQRAIDKLLQTRRAISKAYKDAINQKYNEEFKDKAEQEINNLSPNKTVMEIGRLYNKAKNPNEEPTRYDEDAYVKALKTISYEQAIQKAKETLSYINDIYQNITGEPAYPGKGAFYDLFSEGMHNYDKERILLQAYKLTKSALFTAEQTIRDRYHSLAKQEVDKAWESGAPNTTGDAPVIDEPAPVEEGKKKDLELAESEPEQASDAAPVEDDAPVIDEPAPESDDEYDEDDEEYDERYEGAPDWLVKEHKEALKRLKDSYLEFRMQLNDWRKLIDPRAALDVDIALDNSDFKQVGKKIKRIAKKYGEQLGDNFEAAIDALTDDADELYNINADLKEARKGYPDGLYEESIELSDDNTPVPISKEERDEATRATLEQIETPLTREQEAQYNLTKALNKWAAENPDHPVLKDLAEKAQLYGNVGWSDVDIDSQYTGVPVSDDVKKALEDAGYSIPKEPEPEPEPEPKPEPKSVEEPKQAPDAAPVEVDTATKKRMYKHMLDVGAITQDEYDKRMRELEPAPAPAPEPEPVEEPEVDSEDAPVIDEDGAWESDEVKAAREAYEKIRDESKDLIKAGLQRWLTPYKTRRTFVADIMNAAKNGGSYPEFREIALQHGIPLDSELEEIQERVDRARDAYEESEMSIQLKDDDRARYEEIRRRKEANGEKRYRYARRSEDIYSVDAPVLTF